MRHSSANAGVMADHNVSNMDSPAGQLDGLLDCFGCGLDKRHSRASGYMGVYENRGPLNRPPNSRIPL